ncbi:hypothetical protein MAR_000887 [Mya arenaria]|uniref:Uncharacterized protein n=1 Tax=Mya arenaria TaxID=6604 RepID=A0ABY7FCE9_MYAAR|nr:hypothetical protein MAR_000887 [Mya arenaria]
MRQLETKSVQHTLNVFQNILADIEERSEEANHTAKNIFLKISATISDRASTEKRFNKLRGAARLIRTACKALARGADEKSGNANGVSFMEDKIQEFLNGNRTNNLLKAVFHDIKVQWYLSEVKVLGLISKLITVPL